MRLIVYTLQALPIYILYGFFRILPLDVASYLGGMMMRGLGRFFKKNKIARKNLSKVFPEKSTAEREVLLMGMWENLGRVLGEFPHLSRINVLTDPKRITMMGEAHVRAQIDQHKPTIFVSAHLANWEITSLVASRHGIPLHRIFRVSNNPFVNWLVKFSRRKVLGDMMPKGRAGARHLKRLLEARANLGMLVDQKFNKGPSVSFFGHDAPSLTSYIDFAYDYGYVIIPARVERTKGAHFNVYAYPPLQIIKTGDRAADIRAMLLNMTHMIEQWIRENPEQWLWIHNRWPKG